jgi:hypothetical protein
MRGCITACSNHPQTRERDMGMKLAIVAVAGVVVSIAALTGAFALTGGEFPNIDGDSFGWNSSKRCAFDEKAVATSRKVSWTGSDRVVINVPATIRYRRGTGDQIEMSGDPQMLANIKVEDGKIRLDCSLRRGFPRQQLHITLPGRDFRRFELNGAGEMFLDDLDQDDLQISMAGAGEVHASGKTSTFKLVMIGAGDADAGKLAVRDIDISITGAGSAEVAPQNDADVMIIGAGSVRLMTEPKNLHTNIIGAGDITHSGR